MKSCKLCCTEFEQKNSYQKVCKRCYKIQRGWSSCEGKDGCDELVKPPFNICWTCNQINYKPCKNHRICKKYVKKDSKYPSCYTCFKNKPKEEKVESDSDCEDETQT